ncbi:MAG: HdeD family acid-resistance protein [Woeseiaceae bacterium]|nr:HdeD family acid-resistance protein [Woeseiaceae bacterium]
MSNSSNNVNQGPQLTGLISDAVRTDARLGTISGFFLVVLGFLAIGAPFFSGIAASSIVAALLIAAGMTLLFYCFKARSFGSGFGQFLLGGITIAAGVFMLAQPMLTLYSLTAVLLAFFLADGIVTVYQGIKHRSQEGWGWVVFSGLASIALAALIGYGWPDSGQYAVGILVGVRFMISGWSIAMLGWMSDSVGEGIGNVSDEQVETFVKDLETELSNDDNNTAAQPA